MLQERGCFRRIVVEINGFMKDGVITGFFYVCTDCSNEPQRIVIKTTSDIQIAALGQRLVLMVSTAVLHLGSGDIENSCTGTFRDQMYEAKKILTGITEAHAAACSGFKIRSGSGHVKCNHTLILVPDINHTGKFFVRTGKSVSG